MNPVTHLQQIQRILDETEIAYGLSELTTGQAVLDIYTSVAGEPPNALDVAAMLTFDSAGRLMTVGPKFLIT